MPSYPTAALRISHCVIAMPPPPMLHTILNDNYSTNRKENLSAFRNWGKIFVKWSTNPWKKSP